MISIFKARFSTRRILVMALLLPLFCSGCGFLERNTLGLFSDTKDKAPSERAGSKVVPAAIKNPSVPVGVDSLKTDSQKGSSNIEITWAVPPEELEGYVIHYGINRENLDQEIRLKSAEVERFEDENSRAVYRYVIPNMPPDKTVYLAIAAENAGSLTPLSEIQEVRP